MKPHCLLALALTLLAPSAWAQTLIHYTLNDTANDVNLVAEGIVPNAGTLGNGIVSNHVSLDLIIPTNGVPPGAGNVSIYFNGDSGILAPGTRQLNNTAIFNAGGFTYEAWFDWNGGGTTDTPFLYNGRFGVMTDPNGLLYMRARYYNPYICRFVNPDPTGFAGGLNWYAFADGNPASSLDPFGLDTLNESASASWFSSGFTSSPSANLFGMFPAPTGYSPYFSGDSLGRSLYAGIYNVASLVNNTVLGLIDSASMALNQLGNSAGISDVPLFMATMGVPEAGFAALPELPVAAESVAAETAVTTGDHIVLGLQNFGLEQTAVQVGGRTLMGDPNWQSTLQTALGNSSTRITVTLDGVSGSSADSQFMGAAQQGLGSGAVPGNWFNWEMGQIYQAGQQGNVTFMLGGQVVPNPFR